MQKLKVGDTVQVTAGAERTQKSNRGKILAFDKVKNRVRVEGLRMVKKHVKKGRDRANPEGGILESAGTIALASLSLVCPKCDKPTRVGMKITGEDKKRPIKAAEPFARGGIGAIELAARYERLWFDSPAGNDAPFRNPRAQTIFPSGDRALTLGCMHACAGQRRTTGTFG